MNKIWNAFRLIKGWEVAELHNLNHLNWLLNGMKLNYKSLS